MITLIQSMQIYGYMPWIKKAFQSLDTILTLSNLEQTGSSQETYTSLDRILMQKTVNLFVSI